MQNAIFVDKLQFRLIYAQLEKSLQMIRGFFGEKFQTGLIACNSTRFLFTNTHLKQKK